MEALFANGGILIATTHYSEIKAFAQTTRVSRMAVCSLTPHAHAAISLKHRYSRRKQRLFDIPQAGHGPRLISRAMRSPTRKNGCTKPQSSTGRDWRTRPEKLVNNEILAHSEKSMDEIKRRYEAKKRVEKQKVESIFKLGDCVFVTSMNRTGIVCEEENVRGEVGVMILKKRFTISKKRLRPFIDGKDLYPEDYDLAIVLDSKENRKKSKLMGKHHVEGMVIESPEPTPMRKQ
jgi:hypothetical protein